MRSPALVAPLLVVPSRQECSHGLSESAHIDDYRGQQRERGAPVAEGSQNRRAGRRAARHAQRRSALHQPRARGCPPGRISPLLFSVYSETCAASFEPRDRQAITGEGTLPNFSEQFALAYLPWLT